MDSSTGVLLVNLGSPLTPQISDIKTFLASMLQDRNIVDLPSWFFLPILDSFILNKRPQKLNKAYEAIAIDDMPPLRYYMLRLRHALEMQLNIPVIDAYLYGEDSIEDALVKFSELQLQQVIIIPLFPQSSSTTTTICLEKISKAKDNLELSDMQIRVISKYYEHPLYIEAIKKSIVNKVGFDLKDYHVIFSFHNMPIKYLKKRKDSYDEECLQTTEYLRQCLNLPKERSSLVWQSAFGPFKYLKPRLKNELQSLIKKGVKKVLVVAPGFSVDCLETLHEINVDAKNYFLANGGNDFIYVNALNASKLQINLLSTIVNEQLALHLEQTQ